MMVAGLGLPPLKITKKSVGNRPPHALPPWLATSQLEQGQIHLFVEGVQDGRVVLILSMDSTYIVVIAHTLHLYHQ
jgi:hypothetical protein